MKKISIILVEWDGYKLSRKKRLGENTITCGLGKLLQNINNLQAGVDFNLHLIINSGGNSPRSWHQYVPFLKKTSTPHKTYEILAKKYPFISSVHFRDNTGMDIGAYNYGIDLLKSQRFEGDVLFMNSSLRGPLQDNWLASYYNLFHDSPKTGLCGITLNSHNTNLSPPVFMPHVQSFFLYTDMSVLEDVFSFGFPGGDVTSDKQALIAEGEIGISQKVLKSGYSIRCSAFPEFSFRIGDKWTIPEGDIRFKKEFRQLCNQA